MRSKRISYFQWLIFHKATREKTQDVEVISGRVTADLHSQKQRNRATAGSQRQASAGWPTLRSCTTCSSKTALSEPEQSSAMWEMNLDYDFLEILFKYLPIPSHTFLPEVFLQAILVHDCSHFHEAVLNKPSDMPFTPPALWCPIKGGGAGRKAAVSS